MGKRARLIFIAPLAYAKQKGDVLLSLIRHAPH